MPDEALGSGQVGQPESSASVAGTESQKGSTETSAEQNAPQTEQPLTLTERQLNKYISDILASEKQNWLNEAYQNTQSMNDKFEKRVNDAIKTLESAGIKADKASAAKLLREQDKREAEENAKAQRNSSKQIDPEYGKFLKRFGLDARVAGDKRLQGAHSLEQEYKLELTRDDPEYEEYFADPNKKFSDYQFQRDYEAALKKKKKRVSETNPDGNIAGAPSMSGKGQKSNAIPNTMSSSDLYDRALWESKNKRK